MNQFEDYNNQCEEGQRVICSTLCHLITTTLKKSTSRLFHGAPVWFINENPIVGYSKKKRGIALLFWSGQSFIGQGLSPVGTFKAAEKIFEKIEEVDEKKLTSWLEESARIQWDYKNIRIHNGALKPFPVAFSPEMNQ